MTHSCVIHESLGGVMCSVCEKIGSPSISILVPDGYEVVWYPEEDATDGQRRNYWLLKVPDIEELHVLYNALMSIGGIIINPEGPITLSFSLSQLAPYSTRVSEVAMLVVDVSTVSTAFGKAVHALRATSQSLEGFSPS